MFKNYSFSFVLLFLSHDILFCMEQNSRLSQEQKALIVHKNCDRCQQKIKMDNAKNLDPKGFFISTRAYVECHTSNRMQRRRSLPQPLHHGHTISHDNSFDFEPKEHRLNDFEQFIRSYYRDEFEKELQSQRKEAETVVTIPQLSMNQNQEPQQPSSGQSVIDIAQVTQIANQVRHDPEVAARREALMQKALKGLEELGRSTPGISGNEVRRHTNRLRNCCLGSLACLVSTPGALTLTAAGAAGAVTLAAVAIICLLILAACGVVLVSGLSVAAVVVIACCVVLLVAAVGVAGVIALCALAIIFCPLALVLIVAAFPFWLPAVIIAIDCAAHPERVCRW